MDGLLQFPNFAQAALSGYQAGHAIGDARQRAAILTGLASNPDDQVLTGRLAAVDTEAARQYVGMRSKQREDARDTQFRAATVAYQQARASRPNTLGSLLRRQPLPEASLTASPSGMVPGGVLTGQPRDAADPAIPGSGLPAPTDAVPSEANTPVNLPADADTASMPTASAAHPQIPQEGADAAYQKMVEADPERALAVRSSLAKANADDLNTYQKVNAASLQLMGGVHDQASYDEARRRAHELHEQYGVGPDALQLPDKYDPQTVRGLMMSAMDMSQQLAAARAQQKLDWNIEDDQIDNSRDDRNTDSMISHRRAEEGIAIRGQDVRSSDTRRGQNMTDARGRRSIDVSSSDRQRGQNLEDTRYRDGVQGGARRGGSAGAAAAGAKITRVAVGAGGKKVGWNGTSWVPVK